MSEAKANRLIPDPAKDSWLLLGVTGSIATGKSTVANMLAEMGAPIIDFDILARQVVEPEKPAWRNIVSFFGKEVLSGNAALDRKVLADIIFNNPEKRKKLESFTHPRIHESYVSQLNEIIKNDKYAIILVVVPLLIEVKMQSLFHKLLVVYTSPEIQIERLIKRDGISEKQALKMLNSQISIDEKISYADYVIRNDKSLVDTGQQVEELWCTLQKLRSKNMNQ